MKRIKPILLIGSLLLAYACSPEKRDESTAGAELTSVSELEERASETVLNPNFADREEMKRYLPVNVVDQLESARPIISSAQFIAILRETMDSAQVKKACQNVFLPINLNTASEAEMRMIPDVGDKMVHEFEEYRPYQSMSQFRREIGKYVDESMLKQYEKYVFVPVSLNNASKEEILTIPGVGDKMLHEFEEYRPYESMDQFKREIGKYVNEEELARLARYVVL